MSEERQIEKKEKLEVEGCRKMDITFMPKLKDSRKMLGRARTANA
jgi:hypothetical protein